MPYMILIAVVIAGWTPWFINRLRIREMDKRHAASRAERAAKLAEAREWCIRNGRKV